MSPANEDEEEEDSQEAGYFEPLRTSCNFVMRPPRRRSKKRPNIGDNPRRKPAGQRRRTHIKTMLITCVLAIWFVKAGSQLVGCQVVRQPYNQTSEQAHDTESSPSNSSIGRPAAVTGGQGSQRTSRIYRIRALGSNGNFAGATLRVEPSKLKQDVENQFGDRKQQAGGRLQLQGTKSSRPACVEVETVTTAETSSVSASSPTLRLTGKAQTARGGDGELDESLLARPASGIANGEPQQVAESQAEQSSPSQASNEPQRPPGGFDSVLSLIDEFDSKISTNKTEAQLSCDSGEMVLKLNFSQPFRGVVYPDHNRLSPCRFFGDGHHNYELRLPLRGCGSRQVAPRVFVNDVIVRFHKTLELEEDEVKTLICRYPPPLDAAVGNGQTATGSGLLQSLDSGRYSSADTGHQQPFELIDPSSGRPTTNRLGGGPYQQPETYGELLAPSSGRHRTQSANDLLLASPISPADRILNRHHTALDHQLLSTSPSGVKQSNSRLAQLEAPTRLDDLRANSSSSSSFVDRLTSIELLFLISSLMFLVLLAFGLAGGYYCFSRRDRRRNLPPSSVPKLLSRQRRRRERSYLNSPTSLLGTATNLNQVGPGKHYSAYQHQGGQLFGAGGRQRSAPAESQNFREIYGLADPNSYYQQYLHQQQQQQAHTAPSSPDDSDISGQNLLPASKRVDLSGSYRPTMTSLAPIPSAHYQASTLRSTGYLPAASQPQPPSGVLGRRQNADLVNHPIDQVAGRRAAFYPNNLQRAHAMSNVSALRSSAVYHSQGHPQRQPPAATTSTLGRRVGRLNTGQLVQEQLVNVSAEPLQDVPRHQFEPHHVYRDRPHIKADELSKKSANIYCAQMQHAKSMQKLRDDNQAPNRERQQKHLNDERIRQKQRQHFFDTSTLTRADSRQKHSAELRVLDVSPTDSDSLVTASDSEIELTNERQRSCERPKLVLKSIEDSFVTNLTEIYEQEYKKRDNRRPLSMSEWRSMQPNRSKAGPNLQEDENQDEDDDSNQTLAGQSSQTNLRSLTELDVNFARSLLRPPMSGEKSDEKPTGHSSGSAPGEHNVTTSKSSGEPQQTSTALENSMDDLIISPDYNCGQLKLKRSAEPKGPDGTHSPNDPHESSSFA